MDNLKSMGISWEEAGELAADRTEWRQRVAQCIYDAGWTEQNWSLLVWLTYVTYAFNALMLLDNRKVIWLVETSASKYVGMCDADGACSSAIFV